MSETFSHFTGEIPTDYDEGLGPHLFVDFAAEIARRTAALQPGRVLELAAAKLAAVPNVALQPADAMDLPFEDGGVAHPLGNGVLRCSAASKGEAVHRRAGYVAADRRRR